jgi:hypothetical protein
MAFTRYTDEEILSMNVMTDGVYDAEVMEYHAHDQHGNPLKSKTKKNQYGQEIPGNPMKIVKLNVWDSNGCIHEITDYLVDIKSMAFKTKHFCEATGNIAKYDACQEIVGLDVLGKRIKVVIGTQAPQPKNDGTGGFYSAKNNIKDYVKPLELVSAKTDALPFQDDIKF